MKNESGINAYKDLPFGVQRKLDQKAYSKYFSDRFDESEVLTFNSWYGTKYHETYVNMFLRKYKLEKIEKTNQ